MNDPLKKFVHQHREAFDQLEPPEDVLQRLQARLRPAPPRRRSAFRRFPRTAWLVAASLLIGVICTYLFLDNSRAGRVHRPDIAQQVVDQPVVGKKTPALATPPIESSVTPEDLRETPVREPLKQGHPKTVINEDSAPVSLASRLADSTSASTRLAAILEIEQSERMNGQLVAMLSETMNHDGNTNVRLAALDVLSRHLGDPRVANLLAAALTSQDDPLVQLGIVRIAAQLDHVGIEEALFAVARSPYTFEAVKDEAYAVLLYQEKL
ncbi:MAG TPA: HEAT repeat domain-containing protein [Parapedobacter sp.]|nr:HEAT repeat domain-containing protein [Parapedobacter sp.]